MNVKELIQRRRSSAMMLAADSGHDVLILGDQLDLRWLGYGVTGGALAITDKDIIPASRKDILAAVHQLCARSIAVGEGLTAEDLLLIQQDPDLSFTPFDVSKLRGLKDSMERKLLSVSSRLCANALANTMRRLRLGVTEIETVRTFEDHLWESGWDGQWAFLPSCAFGSRSNLAWAGATKRTLASGDVVCIDVGTMHGGYCSDVTRTALALTDDLAQPLVDEWRSAYRAVSAAIMRCVEEARPGTPVRKLTQISEQTLNEEGFHDSLPVHLGHGVGVRKHEWPVLAPDSSEVVQDGMVFTLEPSVVLSSGSAVRIEEVVEICSYGARILSSPTHFELSSDGLLPVE
jgi:Xaa-Pro aminopeptidase